MFEIAHYHPLVLLSAPASMLALGTAYSLFTAGFSLLATVAGSFGIVSLSMATAFRLFPDFRAHVFKAVDDLIHPPVPVILPETVASVDKTAELKGALHSLENLKNEGDIKDIKSALKKVFELRSYNNAMATEEYELRWEALKDKVENLSKDSNEIKQNPEKLKEWHTLVLETAILDDALLARLEHSLKEQNEPVSTENVSRLLVDQSKPYAFRFINDSLSSIYLSLRNASSISHGFDATGPIQRLTFPQDEAFYQKGNLLNDARKIYNCFMKHGFYQRYGNKAFKYQLLSSHPNGDQRFELYTQKDSKKNRGFFG